MFEIRRGCEKLHELRKSDFKKVYDPVYKFNCWRKKVSEKDKNHKRGTNKVRSCLPFKNFIFIFPG